MQKQSKNWPGVQYPLKEWLEASIYYSSMLEEPTKDLQIANMYRRLQKSCHPYNFSFFKKRKRKKSSFIISFNIFIFFISWHYCKRDAQIILFQEFRLHCLHCTRCIQCIVCMLDCRGANKGKKILIRTAAVRIATSFANIRKMVLCQGPRPPSLFTSMRRPMHGTSCPKTKQSLNSSLSTCLTAKFGSFLDHAKTSEKGQNVISSFVQHPISLIFL